MWVGGRGGIAERNFGPLSIIIPNIYRPNPLWFGNVNVDVDSKADSDVRGSAIALPELCPGEIKKRA